MSVKRFIVKPGDRSPALNVVGVKVTVLVSDKHSQAHQITLRSGDEGADPPPRSHLEPEHRTAWIDHIVRASNGHRPYCEHSI